MKDVYLLAEHYDLMHADTDIDFDFYRVMARQFGGPILELACGTGRITLMLAKEGHEICGIDLSSEFIQIAEKKRLDKNIFNASFFVRDFRSFNLKRKFRFIFIPFNSIAHVYSLQDAKSFFRCIRRHMDENTRFLIDIFNPDPGILSRDARKRYPVSEYRMPRTEERVIVTENNHYDRATQINRIKWYFKIGSKKEIIRELPMRIYYPLELECILTANGFAIENKWGDYQLDKFDSNSKHQLILASKMP